jgi:hypothetical protein
MVSLHCFGYRRTLVGRASGYRPSGFASGRTTGRAGGREWRCEH